MQRMENIDSEDIAQQHTDDAPKQEEIQGSSVRSDLLGFEDSSLSGEICCVS